MGNIVILDENTANKIAAGEVIERPASVVKELVENSIDAGSGNISIEIKNGGITYIKISDNGSGIREDDAEIAFERHATSKIRSADDLEHVLTMGFRGEALASIAAVADVQVTTRVRDSEHGTFVEVRGGKTLDVRQTGCPAGTTIIVRDLFFNTPARFKFLKKDSTEAGYISEAISRIALGNPGISFRLTAGGSQVLYTPGNNDQLSAIFSIYGKETARNVYAVNYTDEKIRITGFAGKPEIARSNRSHQYVYINRRFIKSKIIISAVDEAYNTFLMKNKFPFIVLNVEINPMMVDVNVHPTKMEVKFSNEQDIFKAVYHAINNALLGNSDLRQAVVSEKLVRNPFRMENPDKPEDDFAQQSIRFVSSVGVGEADTKPPHVSRVTYSSGDSSSTGKNNLNMKENSGIQNDIVKERTFGEVESYKAEPCRTEEKLKTAETGTSNYGTPQPKDINKPDIEQKHNISGKSDTAYTDTLKRDFAKASLYMAVDISAGEEPDELLDQVTEQVSNELPNEVTVKVQNECKTASESEIVLPEKIRNLFENARIVGQLFSTYIILQQDEQMILIDQHAAHERIMYEELKKRFENHEPMSQMLLDTIVIELTHQELKLLEEERELFARIGFEFEEFGSKSILLRGVPFSSLGQGAKEIFLETLDKMLGRAKNERLSGTDQTLYTIACKAAVKANRKLDEAEMKSILEKLSAIENPFTCPHGRPSAVRITKYELEKMFKRIV